LANPVASASAFENNRLGMGHSLAARAHRRRTHLRAFSNRRRRVIAALRAAPVLQAKLAAVRCGARSRRAP
jgi:hypothetical protein